MIKAIPIKPSDALVLIDTLLASFHEVEKLTAQTSFDTARVAVLLAGAREAIVDSVKFDFPMYPSEGETSMSSSWLNMLMCRDIGALAHHKGGLLAGAAGASDLSSRVFLSVLIDINSVLISPTLRQPLEKYFDDIEER